MSGKYRVAGDTTTPDALWIAIRGSELESVSLVSRSGVAQRMNAQDEQWLTDAVWATYSVAPALHLLDKPWHSHQSRLPEEGAVAFGDFIESKPLKID